MENACFSVMERGRGDEQRICVTGQAGRRGGHSPDPGSTGRTSTTHMTHCSGGVEIPDVAGCAPRVSGALLRSSWDPELNSLRSSLGPASLSSVSH